MLQGMRAGVCVMCNLTIQFHVQGVARVQECTVRVLGRHRWLRTSCLNACGTSCSNEPTWCASLMSHKLLQNSNLRHGCAKVPLTIIQWPLFILLASNPSLFIILHVRGTKDYKIQRTLPALPRLVPHYQNPRSWLQVVLLISGVRCR